MLMKKVTIVGAGAYALALSRVLDKNGVEVVLFTKIEAEKELLERERGNEEILPSVKIGDTTRVLMSADEAFDNTGVVVVALPSSVLRPIVSDLAEFVTDKVVCLTTKGIEANSGKLMHEVMSEMIDISRLCALSGPSFALEIANFLPTVVTAAGGAEETEVIRSCFENDKFKVEQTTDLAGVLACGAFKNVFAIGAGILAAKGAGSNALSSLITRGFCEMGVLCEALGGQRETMGLACGIGDLVTTCISELSRNRQFGILVGEGGGSSAHEQIHATTIEGYASLSGAMKVVRDSQLDLPIIKALDNIVNDSQPPELLLEAICK